MLEEYRREYADFNAAWMREHYLYFSGQKAELELARLYDRYGDLFTKESIDALKKRLEETSPYFENEYKSLEHLLAFATGQFLESSVKELTQEISQHEAAATVEWMGQRITFQDAAVALITEPVRERRRALYDKRARIIESSNDLRAERLAKLYETAQLLGYENYTALYERLHHLNYSALAREVRSLLDRTEPVYVSRMNEALRRDLSLSLEEAERSDMMYFLHLSSYDDRFPADQLLRVYRETMAGLKISVEAQQNIFIDSEPRPRKTPRAFCAPVLIPDEVKLVIRPMGGQSDFSSFFHEAGHAQHFGWTSKELRPEFKYTGDPALTETYAFLFNHLIYEGAWLAQMLRFKDNRDFVRSGVLTKLVTVRRYAAKFLYELELHTSQDVARGSGLYAELLTDATKFKNFSTEFLFDLDDSFYSAGYLRAWAFEVALREYLKTRFGREWWSSARAGSLLKEIWETGDRYTADEMASQIGIGPISFDTLIDDFNQTLR